MHTLRKAIRRWYRRPRIKVESLEELVTRHEEQPPPVKRPESHSEPPRPAISDECAALIQDIRSSNDETRRYMRALFEEYLGPLKAKYGKDSPDT